MVQINTNNSELAPPDDHRVRCVAFVRVSVIDNSRYLRNSHLSRFCHQFHIRDRILGDRFSSSLHFCKDYFFFFCTKILL